jgi:hypothetical protein
LNRTCSWTMTGPIVSGAMSPNTVRTFSIQTVNAVKF